MSLKFSTDLLENFGNYTLFLNRGAVKTESMIDSALTQYKAIAQSSPLQDFLSIETQELLSVPSVAHALKSLSMILQNKSCVQRRIILKPILKE
jgi:hypothetical protein